MTSAGAFYDAETTHTRLAPFKRRFRHRMFQVFLDIDRVAEAAEGLRLFSHNRPNLLAFYDRDHGARVNAPLRPWAEAQFQAAGIELGGGPIRLLTFPRVFGYVFNPISLFFGYGPDEAPRGVLYEVNNTFGDTHTYAAALQSAGPASRHTADKQLHVSPFFDVSGRYRFTVTPPGERFALSVVNESTQGPLHAATLTGRRKPLTDATLLSALARMPAMTLGVTVGIHAHALMLWLRGARYRRKPAPPEHALTPALPLLPASAHGD